MKEIRLIENSPITGVKYGLVEVYNNDKEIQARRTLRDMRKISHKLTSKIRSENTKSK